MLEFFIRVEIGGEWFWLSNKCTWTKERSEALNCISFSLAKSYIDNLTIFQNKPVQIIESSEIDEVVYSKGWNLRHHV